MAESDAVAISELGSTADAGWIAFHFLMDRARAEYELVELTPITMYPDPEDE